MYAVQPRGFIRIGSAMEQAFLVTQSPCAIRYINPCQGAVGVVCCINTNNHAGFRDHMIDTQHKLLLLWLWEGDRTYITAQPNPCVSFASGAAVGTTRGCEVRAVECSWWWCERILCPVFRAIVAIVAVVTFVAERRRRFAARSNRRRTFRTTTS